MATILAYTSPAAGHLFPLVPGLLELQARGHDVHLLAPAEHVGHARAAGLDARPMDERPEVAVKDYDARPTTSATSGSPPPPWRRCATSPCG